MSDSAQSLQILPERYQIIERLGAGGMATVYKAQDTTLQRPVAVKVLHDHLVFETSFRERFEREARIIANFRHPHIVPIYDFSTRYLDDGRYLCYMVMPFLPGKTLADVLYTCQKQNETIPLARVRQIMADVAAALAYAHDRGMIHRDIKPANVLFDENQRAVLTDFGIARLLHQTGITQEGLIVGTPAYMAPEQAAGEPIDGRSDIYALGIMLYELLTGKVPYSSDDGTLAVLYKHANQPIPRVSDTIQVTNPDIDLVVQKALAKSPQDRYQTVSAFAADLETVFSGQRLASAARVSAPAKTLEFKADNLPTQVFSTPTPTPTFLQSLTTAILQPARQNPLGLAALAVAIIALLFVARLSQAPETIAAPTPLPTVAGMTADTTESMTDSMTGDTPFYFTSTFDAADPYNALWQSDDDADMMRRAITDGVYSLENTVPGTATTSLFDPAYTYSNVSISMTAQLAAESATSSGYGIVFRYLDPQNYYVFAVDGRGRYSVWAREAGTWIELRGREESWSESLAVLPIGESNTLRVNAYNNGFTGFVNNIEVFKIGDNLFESGAIGIYMATPNNGTARVSIEEYTVSRGVPMTDSMTDMN